MLQLPLSASWSYILLAWSLETSDQELVCTGRDEHSCARQNCLQGGLIPEHNFPNHIINIMTI